MPHANFLQERDVLNGLKDGGAIRGVFLVARPQAEGYEFMPYLLPSWTRIYLPLALYEGRADKTYRNAGRFIQLVRRDFRYIGPVLIHEANSPDLARFKGLRAVDAPPGWSNKPSDFTTEAVEEAQK